VVTVARHGTPVGLDPEVTSRLDRGRDALERLDLAGETVYGVTTGVGKLKDTRIPPEARRALQRNLVLSHPAGGPQPPPPAEPLDAAETRAVLVLLAASLARGHSGVRPVVVERLLGCLNHGILPIVPSRGSVGASGDLAPLAHVAACLIGEGDAMVDGTRRPA